MMTKITEKNLQILAMPEFKRYFSIDVFPKFRKNVYASEGLDISLPKIVPC